MTAAGGEGAGRESAFSDLAHAAGAWRARHGRPPPVFVSDVTTTDADPRADAMVACLVSCGFELHRNDGVDDVAALVAGVKRSGAGLVLLCYIDPTVEDVAKQHWVMKLVMGNLGIE